MIAGLSSGLTPHDVNQGDHTSMHVNLMKVAAVSKRSFLKARDRFPASMF